MFATGPGQTFTVAVFVDPMATSLGLSKTAISTAYTIAGTAAALVVLQLGRLIAADGLWRATLERGTNSEITTDAMRRAYAPARSAAERMTPKRGSTENAVRFTADGRMVLKWAPKRRIEKPAASARGT